MGQFHDSTMTTHVTFDENGDNGLVVAGRYLPEELLSEIFCYVDHKSLLNCQLVCKRWKMLIESYVWRKKAEILMGRLLKFKKDAPWHVYYLICKKKPFERNLLKNNSGQDGKRKYWSLVQEGGDGWTVENPPLGAPLLPNNESVFEGKQYCFSTSYSTCSKIQVIDLQAEGFSPYILDNLQPPIVVSEWYSCRWDCAAIYDCIWRLMGKDNNVLVSFEHHDIIEGERQNKWYYVSHTFQNYGPGVRKISFCHAGKDHAFWAGNYGSKMAGACVSVKIPTVQHSENE